MSPYVLALSARMVRYHLAGSRVARLTPSNYPVVRVALDLATLPTVRCLFAHILALDVVTPTYLAVFTDPIIRSISLGVVSSAYGIRLRAFSMVRLSTRLLQN